eukprot:3592373-Pyramimonas_sp.AAC.1
MGLAEKRKGQIQALKDKKTTCKEKLANIRESIKEFRQQEKLVETEIAKTDVCVAELEDAPDSEDEEPDDVAHDHQAADGPASHN